MSINMKKMRIKTKLITSFSLIIILNLALATILYFSFNTVKNNVHDIEQQFTPAANSVRDLRSNSSLVYAARGDLLEGAFTYQQVLLDGGTTTEAKAAATPFYNAGRQFAIDKSSDLISIYQQFYEIDYFSEAEREEIKNKILLVEFVFTEFMSLSQYYEFSDWERAEVGLASLNTAAIAADAGIVSIEQMIDQQVAAMNQQTTQKANTAVWLILGLNGVAVIIGLILAFGLTGMIATPLRRLTRAANNIGEGDVDTDIPVIKTRDEVRDLANALETMRGAIRFLKQNGFSHFEILNSNLLRKIKSPKIGRFHHYPRNLPIDFYDIASYATHK